MQIWPVFWQLFSFPIPRLAEQSESTRSLLSFPGLLVDPQLSVLASTCPCTVSVHSVQSPRAPLPCHHILIYMISLLVVKETLPAVGFSGPIVHIIPHLLCLVSRPWMCSCPLQRPIHCICPWVWKYQVLCSTNFLEFSPVLFQPVPVSPSLRKDFLPSKEPDFPQCSHVPSQLLLNYWLLLC